MAGYWLKLYTEILDDPKYFKLSDNAKLGMIELMVVAKRINLDGEIPEIEDVAFHTRRTVRWWTKVFDELISIDYLVKNGEKTIIRKFAERQSAVLDSERQRQHRIVTHKKEFASQDCNEVVTKSNGDSDSDSDSENIISTFVEPPSFIASFVGITGIQFNGLTQIDQIKELESLAVIHSEDKILKIAAWCREKKMRSMNQVIAAIRTAAPNWDENQPEDRHIGNDGQELYQQASTGKMYHLVDGQKIFDV